MLKTLIKNIPTKSLKITIQFLCMTGKGTHALLNAYKMAMLLFNSTVDMCLFTRMLKFYSKKVYRKKFIINLLRKNPPAASESPPKVFARMFITANSVCDCLISCNVSREKEEKVVNPPNKPTKRNRRNPGFDRSDSWSPARIPINKEPERLTNSVPQGNKGCRK